MTYMTCDHHINAVMYSLAKLYVSPQNVPQQSACRLSIKHAVLQPAQILQICGDLFACVCLWFPNHFVPLVSPAAALQRCQQDRRCCASQRGSWTRWRCSASSSPSRCSPALGRWGGYLAMLMGGLLSSKSFLLLGASKTCAGSNSPCCGTVALGQWTCSSRARCDLVPDGQICRSGICTPLAMDRGCPLAVEPAHAAWTWGRIIAQQTILCYVDCMDGSPSAEPASGIQP